MKNILLNAINLYRDTEAQQETFDNETMVLLEEVTKGVEE